MAVHKGKRRRREGIVVGDKMLKTRVVRAVRLTRHSLYAKTIRKYINFKIHDEQNRSKTGDRVLVEETRPLSKDKRWRLVRVLESAKE